MPLLLDDRRPAVPSYLTPDSTLGDYLAWAQTQLAEGRIVTQIRLNDDLLDGPAIARSRKTAIAGATLSLITADRRELSLTTLGKLAALVQWLAPQHAQVAASLERGDIQPALNRLHELLSAWQQIQSAYANLAKLLEISLAQLPVGELTGESVLNEFCHQLSEIQTALQSKDFVLLADILQYEMDTAVSHWTNLLAATLGIADPAACTAS